MVCDRQKNVPGKILKKADYFCLEILGNSSSVALWFCQFLAVLVDSEVLCIQFAECVFVLP